MLVWCFSFVISDSPREFGSDSSLADAGPACWCVPMIPALGHSNRINMAAVIRVFVLFDIGNVRLSRSANGVVKVVKVSEPRCQSQNMRVNDMRIRETRKWALVFTWGLAREWRPWFFPVLLWNWRSILSGQEGNDSRSCGNAQLHVFVACIISINVTLRTSHPNRHSTAGRGSGRRVRIAFWLPVSLMILQQMRIVLAIDLRHENAPLGAATDFRWPSVPTSCKRSCRPFCGLLALRSLREWTSRYQEHLWHARNVHAWVWRWFICVGTRWDQSNPRVNRLRIPPSLQEITLTSRLPAQISISFQVFLKWRAQVIWSWYELIRFGSLPQRQLEVGTGLSAHPIQLKKIVCVTNLQKTTEFMSESPSIETIVDEWTGIVPNNLHSGTFHMHTKQSLPSAADLKAAWRTINGTWNWEGSHGHPFPMDSKSCRRASMAHASWCRRADPAFRRSSDAPAQLLRHSLDISQCCVNWMRSLWGTYRSPWMHPCTLWFSRKNRIHVGASTHLDNTFLTRSAS